MDSSLGDRFVKTSGALPRLLLSLVERLVGLTPLTIAPPQRGTLVGALGVGTGADPRRFLRCVLAAIGQMSRHFDSRFTGACAHQSSWTRNAQTRALSGIHFGCGLLIDSENQGGNS